MKRFSIKMLLLQCWCLWLFVAPAAAGTIAVLPLQDLEGGYNYVDLLATQMVVDHLSGYGAEIIDVKPVIAFMANNRIRQVGHIESFNIEKAANELGASFLLVGTISQRKRIPEPAVGLTLSLIRCSDARVIWSYVGSASQTEERRVLAVGEPRTTADIMPLLLNEVVAQLPWRQVNEFRQSKLINLDSYKLQPSYVRPGKTVRCQVRLRDAWPGEEAPQVFFKVSDQLYPATEDESETYFSGSWVAGQDDGKVSVELLVKWEAYQRSESILLGSYEIDGTSPLLEIDLGNVTKDDPPVAKRRVKLVPRLAIHENLSRWQLAITDSDGLPVGKMGKPGNLPGSLIWSGRGGSGDGIYNLEIQVWDLAGNTAKVSKFVELIRSVGQVGINLVRGDGDEKQMTVDLEYDGRIPLQYWRLEMWTNEGRMLTKAEGTELPVSVAFNIEDPNRVQGIEGFLYYKDEAGSPVRKQVQDLIPELKKPKNKKQKPAGISKSWVDEF